MRKFDIRDITDHCYHDGTVNILTQTYFIKGDNENDKIYLQKKIQNNEIFQSKEFWEDFIDFSINKEIIQCVKNDVKSGNILKENKKETEDKIKNIAFAQIISYADNMKSFGIDKEIIKEVVLPKTEKYKFDNELIDSITGIINNS